MIDALHRGQIESILGRSLTNEEMTTRESLGQLSTSQRSVATILANQQLVLAEMYLSETAHAPMGSASAFRESFRVCFREETPPLNFPGSQGALIVMPTRPPYRIGSHIVAYRSQVTRWGHALTLDQFREFSRVLSEESHDFDVPRASEVEAASLPSGWASIPSSGGSFITWRWSEENAVVPLIEYSFGGAVRLSMAWVNSQLHAQFDDLHGVIDAAAVRLTVAGDVLLSWDASAVTLAFAYRSTNHEVVILETSTTI